MLFTTDMKGKGVNGTEGPQSNSKDEVNNNDAQEMNLITIITHFLSFQPFYCYLDMF